VGIEIVFKKSVQGKITKTDREKQVCGCDIDDTGEKSKQKIRCVQQRVQ
jgi:hypothetical protein